MMRSFLILLGTVGFGSSSDARKEVGFMLEAARELRTKTPAQVDMFASREADSFVIPRHMGKPGAPWFEGTKDSSMLHKLKVSISSD